MEEAQGKDLRFSLLLFSAEKGYICKRDYKISIFIFLNKMFLFPLLQRLQTQDFPLVLLYFLHHYQKF